MNLMNSVELLCELGVSPTQILFQFQLSPTKPVNGWFHSALIMRESARALEGVFGVTKLPIGMTHEVLIPSIVLTAFSCELLLKSLMSNFEKIHNIANLFNSLNQNVMNSISKKVIDELNNRIYEKQDDADRDLIDACKKNGMSENDIICKVTDMKKSRKNFIKINGYNEKSFSLN